MPSNAVLAAAAGVVGAAVIGFAILGPGQSPAEPDPADITVSATAEIPAASDVPTGEPAPGTAQESPSSAVSDPGPDPSATATLPTDPMQLINTGLVQYQQSVANQGGAEVALVTSNGAQVTLSLASNGEYRAVTNIPTAPEWVFSEGRLYARLGDKEVEAQKEGLAAIGKPTATWTDAAVGADQQAAALAAGNLVNAVADLVPHLEEATVARGSNGNISVDGYVSPAALGETAATYGLKADAADGAKAKVAFVFTPDGSLSGYVVSPPAAGQPVSAVVKGFAPVSVAAPDAAIVVTLEDLARAASPAAAPAPSVQDPAAPAVQDPAAPAVQDPAAPAPAP